MNFVRNTWAIFLRELGGYFLSPIAYVVLFLFLLTNGAMFSFLCYSFVGQPRQITMVIERLFGFNLFWVLPLSPLLTMRLFAEEKRTGSIELLMTAPVRETEVVLGKFLAAQGFYMFVWTSLLPLMGILAVLGNPDWGPVAALYAFLFCLGFMTNSLGVLASAGTKNQLVSAVFALSGNLLFILVSALHVLFPHEADVRRLIQYVSFTSHFDADYIRGVVDLRYLFYYASFTVLFLFFSVRVLEAHKWR